MFISTRAYSHDNSSSRSNTTIEGHIVKKQSQWIPNILR
ncbi:hypothetical protein LINPERPRIM_LOCUS37772, partial [Linum perenne]